VILERAERTRRRRRNRRRRRIARAAAIVAALVLALVVAIVARSSLDGSGASSRDAVRPSADGTREPSPSANTEPAASKPAAAPRARRPPREIRGVHVTMRLASSPAKVDDYLSLPGINTLEVDVKDEGGLVAFVSASVPLARQVGAARSYYSPWRLARQVHGRGAFLVGRVVTFQDPLLVRGRPELGLRRSDGTVWRNDAGREWSNPYDRRVWK
jgi:hypothetical protein